MNIEYHTELVQGVQGDQYQSCSAWHCGVSSVSIIPTAILWINIYPFMVEITYVSQTHKFSPRRPEKYTIKPERKEIAAVSIDLTRHDEFQGPRKLEVKHAHLSSYHTTRNLIETWKICSCDAAIQCPMLRRNRLDPDRVWKRSHARTSKSISPLDEATLSSSREFLQKLYSVRLKTKTYVVMGSCSTLPDTWNVSEHWYCLVAGSRGRQRWWSCGSRFTSE